MCVYVSCKGSVFKRVFHTFEYAHMQVPRALAASDAMERALRMLDATPVTLTHKFGVLYVADGQRSEAEFLGNSGGSEEYEAFLHGLGDYISLAECQPHVFTGGLDRSGQSRDGQMALFWRNKLVQCVFFVGTLMTKEPGPEQVFNKGLPPPHPLPPSLSLSCCVSV